MPRHIVYRLPEGLSFEQAAMVEAVSGADVACEVVGIARASIRVDPLISAATPLAEGSQWLDRLYEREPGLMKVILKP